MAKPFRVSIVTPDKIFYEGDIVSLVAPGEVGYLGVLADHAPLISNLTKGKITLSPADGSSPIVFNSPGNGFLQVLKNQVTILLRTLERKS